MKQKITFIGIGKIGSAMSEQLLKSGYLLTVYNRTKEKTKTLATMGAEVAEILESAVSEAEIIFTSLIDDEALIKVSQTILPKLKKGTIHVSTSTILPKTATQLAKQYSELGCFYIAAPVLGVPSALRERKATTLCSGDQKSIGIITPLLNTYSASIKNLGTRIADANVLKICLNYSLITAIELISELYVFAEKSGLDTILVQEALHQIYAHPAFKLYIDKIHKRDFDHVNFDMRGGNKDIHLFLKAFSDADVIPDLGNAIYGKFTQALNNGMSDKDWSAISEIVREHSRSTK